MMAINPPTGPFHVSTDGSSESRLEAQNLELGSTPTPTCSAFVILTTTWERVHRSDDLKEESRHFWSGITDPFWTSPAGASASKQTIMGNTAAPPLGASTGAKEQHQHQVQFCLLSQYNEDGAC